MIKDHEKLLKRVQRTLSDWRGKSIKGPMGYQFQTNKFLGVIFLLKNSVDVANPDILGRKNKNTFINDAYSVIEKIKEQVRLNLTDLNFRIFNDIYLGKYVVKAANTKTLKENKFHKEMDQWVDDAEDYGSGFLKIWLDSKSTMKMRCIDPHKIAWDPYDFENGPKVEQSRKTYRSIIKNKKYDSGGIAKLRSEVGEDVDDKWDESTTIEQYVKDTEDGKQEIIVTAIDHKIVLMHEIIEKQVFYLKYDREKRRGFPDALGIGNYEIVFNRLIQSKVNRSRLDGLMAIASKGMMQKRVDGERDSIAGKSITSFKTGGVVGYKDDNRLEPLDVGFDKAIAHVKNEINDMAAGIGENVNVSDAAQGKTLPASTSGVLGTLLTENSTSVLKERQIKFGNTLDDEVYGTAGLKKYLLKVFDSNENLEKYLSPNDLNVVKRHVINQMVALKQVDALIDGVEFDEGIAREEAQNEIKGKTIIPGPLLERLRNDIDGITLFITGENFNKANAVAHLREMRADYVANKDLFRDPVYLELRRREADLEVGVNALQIDEIIEELPPEQQQTTEGAPQQDTATIQQPIAV